MLENKKLLILINNLNFFISHRLPIAQAAKLKGLDIVIGYGELGGADNISLKKQGFKLTYIPINRGSINPFKELKTFLHIWKFLKSEKPDITHLVTIKPCLYGGIIARILNLPSVVIAVSGLGTLFISEEIKGKILRFFLFWVYKFIFNHSNQKVIFQNNDDLNLFVNLGVLNKSKTKIIKGSGVNLKKFKNFKEPGGIPIVCFAARLIKHKGLYEFISAASLLKKRGVMAKFYLAGDIDIKNPSSLNIDDLEKIKEEAIVKVLGYHQEIPLLYAKSHIICLPSYREGLPKSLIEAAAASRPIVTTNVPGCRDVIIPNKTGLLVPVKDSHALANALQRLIENTKERIDMGKAGRKFAEKHFALEEIVQNHLDVYQSLMNKFI